MTQYNDRKVGSVWTRLVPNLHKLFKDIDIEPALLHGDLWGGNSGETDGEPGELFTYIYFISVSRALRFWYFEWSLDWSTTGV